MTRTGTPPWRPLRIVTSGLHAEEPEKKLPACIRQFGFDAIDVDVDAMVVA